MTSRQNDIRNIMNLMESAPPVSLSEAADPSELERAVNAVIDHIKAAMDKNPQAGYAIIDNSGEYAAEIFPYADPIWERLYAAGWPQSSASEFKFLNEKFKEKFGLGLYKYADKLEDEAHQADLKSIKPADKKIYKTIGNKLTVSVTPKWAAENLMFYVMSAQKVVIEDTGSSFPSAVIGKPSLAEFKMTQEQFVEWLLAHGIKQKKRPTRKKATPSYYD